MEYDEVVKAWAAERWGLDINTINHVSFDGRTGYGGGCETCDYGADYGGIDVDISFNDGTRMQSYEFDNYSFAEILKELIAFGR